MTVPMLCEDLWQTQVSPQDWPHLQNLNLTKEIGELTPVHVIIGLDSYFRFFGTQVIRGGDDDPVAVETLLGIICGPDHLWSSDIVGQGTKMQGPLHQNGRSSECSTPEVLGIGCDRYPPARD
ncbi:hypothetical protein T07_4774 [Trichinella nelsoni]|uniref:Peptidase aspartic putative domain-containing protein n=1 Tax=Trichinella nelsoni TaxID=6336 RepID=A0A0V0S053_9BILA|nr:hypothetical protein T07_4774 [Trichinella nelsoni]